MGRGKETIHLLSGLDLHKVPTLEDQEMVLAVEDPEPVDGHLDADLDGGVNTPGGPVVEVSDDHFLILYEKIKFK